MHACAKNDMKLSNRLIKLTHHHLRQLRHQDHPCSFSKMMQTGKNRVSLRTFRVIIDNIYMIGSALTEKSKSPKSVSAPAATRKPIKLAIEQKSHHLLVDNCFKRDDVEYPHVYLPSPHPHRPTYPNQLSETREVFLLALATCSTTFSPPFSLGSRYFSSQH